MIGVLLAPCALWAQGPGYRVYLFMSETCPICQHYTLPLRNLHRDFAADSVQFIGVFPNRHSTPEAVAAFGAKYKLPFALAPDDSLKSTTRHWQATVTPEVVVARGDSVLYRGRIDDGYARVGRRRTVVTTHELRDVLMAIRAGKPVAVGPTTPIGCFINFKY